MKVRKLNQTFTITTSVSDSETNLFIRCKIFDSQLNDVTSTLTGSAFLNLPHIFSGMYGSATVNASIEGNFVVKFFYYIDSSFLYPSPKYGSHEEDYWVTDFEKKILDKIPNNILLDDDVRLDNLGLIPDVPNTTVMTSLTDNVIEQIRNTVDDSDGKAV